MRTSTTCTGEFVIEQTEWQSMCSVSVLAEAASRFSSNIVVRCGDLSVNAKSLTSLMMLNITYKAAVTVIVSGCDAHTAMATIAQLFTTGLGC